MSTTRVCVCFALKEESIPFSKLVQGIPRVHIAIVGVGPANSARSIQKILAADHFMPDLVLTCGYAGGLASNLSYADVVFEADPSLELDSHLISLGCHRARFHCDTRILATADEKQRARADTGADAVEMESSPIRQACRNAGIPSATIRVISDIATEDLPLDFNRIMKPDGSFSPWRLAVELARHPGAVPDLLRLRKRNLRAAARLAAVLAAVVNR